MASGGKSKRLRERVKLSLPVRVQGRESAEHEWTELSHLLDVTPFGAALTLTRSPEPGRLLHLTLPMPRQLRCFDHVEDQYRVWAVVRRVAVYVHGGGAHDAAKASAQPTRFQIGVAFIGKYAPASYMADVTRRYEVKSLSPDSGVWELREATAQRETNPQPDRPDDTRRDRSEDTRLSLPVEIELEVCDEGGATGTRELTVTENISRRGAAVWTTLPVARGQLVRVTSVRYQIAVTAIVRARRIGVDGIPRLHLEFTDRQWPLEGID